MANEAFEPEDGRNNILTNETLIDPEFLSIDRIRFTKEEARQVEQMWPHVMHRKVPLGVEERLIIEQIKVAIAELNVRTERTVYFIRNK
jgi:hypothetical protein